MIHSIKQTRLLLAAAITCCTVAATAQAECRQTEQSWQTSYAASVHKLTDLEYAASYLEGLVYTGDKTLTTRSAEQHKQFVASVRTMLAKDEALASTLNEEVMRTAVALRECGLTGELLDANFKQALRILGVTGRLASIRLRIEEQL